MKCPHCKIEVNESYTDFYRSRDAIGPFSISAMTCPNTDCKKIIIKFIRFNNTTEEINEEVILYPFVSSRPKAPVCIDKKIADDYNEACLVLSLSPKASAALSRRCLQHILREKAGVKPGNLIKEIDQVLADPKTPTYITESIDAVRNVGNFAAHPQKDQISGDIIDVEPGEAEWLLDVLELLFDFYYVQPVIAKKKKAALDAKLALAGKPPMK